MGLGTVVRVAPIEVVLPTYNGVLYLEAQIASIYNQTLRPERVLLRDDGSSDGTQALISQLRQRYGAWLQVLPADGNLGCMANVNRLLQATTAPFVALADQDDFWLPQKLEVSLKRLQQLETQYGPETPLLVHSDLELVDQDGTPLGFHYLKRQRLDPLRTAPVDLALTNVVTGCTALLNRSLLEKALPIPPQAVMHDWWMALVTSVFGQIELLPQTTVLYRQHGGNVLGAQGLGLIYWCRRLRLFLADPAAAGTLRSALEQEQAFEKRYGHPLTVLPALMQLPRRTRWFALSQLPTGQRLRKHGLLRSLITMAFLLTLPR
jgi:hypothetical protein